MRAVVVDHWIEPSQLQVHEIPEPVPGVGQVVVDVHSAGCNFFDILIIAGKYQVKPEFPFSPGGEFAGVISAFGPGTSGFCVGDRVYGHVPYGAYAQKLAVSAEFLRRIPEDASYDSAAAIPIVYPTSYAALVPRAQLRETETLLVHAAAGGVGLAAVQIGKALGARVIATAGGREKLEIARRAGADLAIDYREEDWVAAVREATDGRGADVIYDPVGGDIFDGSLRCIAWNGRLLVIGFASGTIPSAKANRILLKNISVVGVHWSAYHDNQPEAVGPVFEGLERMLASGSIRPLIFGTYTLEQLPEALEALGSRATWGKLIIHP
ncbi:MAG: NADPH:quinone oxidoreductase family protein [bacterium]|nr:NADPH:quinone oxidoreductase family protein [bacterium]